MADAGYQIAATLAIAEVDDHEPIRFQDAACTLGPRIVSMRVRQYVSARHRDRHADA
jgi:hypothetical protein